MAININNLVVRLHVNESNTGVPKKSTGNNHCGCDSIDKEEVVQDTIKEVIRILKELEER
jgi:hypothetical protein